MARPRAALAPALALAALLAAGALPWVQAQQASASDLRLDDVLPGTPRVGQAANVTARLTNLGPEAALTFTVTFGWGNTSGANVLGTAAWPGDAANFTAPGGGPSPCLSTASGLARDCGVEARLNWTPTEGRAGAGVLAARVDLGFTNTDPAGDNNAASNATFAALHRLRLDIAGRDDHGKAAKPGETAFYRVALRNDGNVPDTALARIDAADWVGSVAANGTVVPAPSLQVAIAPGDNASLLALLRAPASSASTVATVTANSTIAPALGGAELALPRTEVDASRSPVYGFEVEPPEVADVPQGSVGEVALAARNAGTTEDALRWQLLAPPPAGWEADFRAEWVGLEATAGARATTMLRVRADPALGPGANATLALRATSLNGAATRDVNVTAHTPAPDLVLVAFLADRAGFPATFDATPTYAGDVLRVRADVRNDGTLPLPKPARFVVEAHRAGVAPSVVGDQVVGSLGPAEARTLFVDWPTGNATGEATLVARLDPDASIPELHEDNNDAEAVVVVRSAGLEATAPAERSVLPGARLTLPQDATFMVRNTGNAAERVLVHLATPRGWIDAAQTLDVPAGASAPVPVALLVPSFPGTLQEPLLLEASLANRSTTVARSELNLSIVDDDPPALESLDAPGAAVLGEPARFRAVVRDAVGVRDVELRSRMPDGEVRVQAMTSLDGTNWTASLVPTRPGALAYWIVARDATPANHTLDTSGTPGGLLVEVAGIPLLELLQPADGSALRSGTPIRLRVSDVHGITAVTVRDGARQFGVPDPYAIDTTGWAQGAHVLAVQATNAFANTANATFHFTIDDTPPIVRSARAEPARAAVGQQVAVEARTSSDAARGMLLVLRGGEVLREVPASVGLGVFNATLALDAPGAYTLGIRVEDEAGNAASTTVPLEVGGPGLPMPGLAPLMGALAAAALTASARRSRRR
jgi:CARDB protein